MAGLFSNERALAWTRCATRMIQTFTSIQAAALFFADVEDGGLENPPRQRPSPFTEQLDDAVIGPTVGTCFLYIC
jgi:hypothetical protein